MFEQPARSRYRNNNGGNAAGNNARVGASNRGGRTTTVIQKNPNVQSPAVSSSSVVTAGPSRSQPGSGDNGGGGNVDRGQNSNALSSSSNVVAQNALSGVRSIGIPENVLDDFRKVYKNLVTDANIAEASAKSLEEIQQKNFLVAEAIASFENAVRSYANRNTAFGRVANVSLKDLEMLDSEKTRRLFRSATAFNARNQWLGNEFLAAIDPANLKKRLNDALQKVEQGGGSGDSSGGGDDESSEEANPESVNLDKNDGLYSLRSTADAIPLQNLIGYTNEAREIVSYCRRVEFLTGDDDAGSAAIRNNPVTIALYGPPGTGKTTIAQSVARYMDVVYMYVNAENVTSQWAGGTEKNISKIFRRARIASKRYSTPGAPPRRVLILIDEIDGLIKNRADSSRQLTGEEYSRITTFLQMLTPPLGTDNSNLIVMFTTNRLENIDSAVLNRARGRIFMGYVVSPNDRITLVNYLFKDYVKSDQSSQNARAVDVEPDRASRTNSAFENIVIECDDLVPRDLQNVLASVKNRILQRFEGTNPTVDIKIDLSNEDNRITYKELGEILRNAQPATNAQTLFRDYSPPHEHVCKWLSENAKYLDICRSASVYRSHGQDC